MYVCIYITCFGWKPYFKGGPPWACAHTQTPCATCAVIYTHTHTHTWMYAFSHSLSSTTASSVANDLCVCVCVLNFAVCA